MCTASYRIPASACTHQGPGKGSLIPLDGLEGGPTRIPLSHIAQRSEEMKDDAVFLRPTLLTRPDSVLASAIMRLFPVLSRLGDVSADTT